MTQPILSCSTCSYLVGDPIRGTNHCTFYHASTEIQLVNGVTTTASRRVLDITHPNKVVACTKINADILVLGLDRRSLAGLQVMGIHTTEQLCQLTEIDIMKGPDLGGKSIAHIKAILATYNLSLKNNPIIGDIPPHEFEIK